jgi:hypothetical protein
MAATHGGPVLGIAEKQISITAYRLTSRVGPNMSNALGKSICGNLFSAPSSRKGTLPSGP